MPIYYKRDATGTANWNLATSWSTVSSTSATNTGPFPSFPSSTTLDPVIFDANSSACTVNVLSNCTSLDFTTYAATITMTNTLQVHGNIALGVGMGIAGTGTLVIAATSTYTSNGVTWPNTLSLGIGPSITITLASLITTVQNLSNDGSNLGIITTVNGNTLNILGNLTLFVILAGSTQINLTGTGTWNSANALAEVRNKLNIDTLGTITRGANGYTYSGLELKYTKGNLVNGSTYLYLSYNANTSSIISNGVNWGNVYILQNTTTLTDDMNINNLEFSFNNAVLNGSNLRINGNINLAAGAQVLTGTTVLRIIGTGNQTWTTGNSTCRIGTSMNIDKVSGTFTLNSANIAYGSATSILTYTKGTFVPSTSTFLTPTGGVTFNITASGFSLNNWSPVVGTYTINTNPLIINSSLLLSGSTTFAGTAGWTCATLTCTTNNSTITLQNSVTYRTTTGVQLVSSLSTQPIIIVSNNPSIRAIWTLDYGATQSIIYVNGTRIDSSLGQTIWTFGGLISNTPLGAETLNWRTGTRPGTIAYVFLN
jgi:hypothetical protein